MSAKSNNVELSPQPLVGRDPETGRFICLPGKPSNIHHQKFKKIQDALFGLAVIASVIFLGWSACNAGIVWFLFYWVLITLFVLYLLLLILQAILRGHLSFIEVALIGFISPVIYFASFLYFVGQCPS